MNKFLIIIAFTFFQFSIAQNTRNVGEFSSLKVYDQIKVTLHHSGENSVETDNSDVEIVNKNGELKIRMIPAKILQGNQTNVKIYYDQLCDLQASQGSIISADSDLDCTSLNLTSNEGSKIILMVNTDILEAKLNSGGMIDISGIATEQNVIVNSGGTYAGKNLDSQKATITSNAGGNAEIKVSDSVNATIRIGGIIDIYGNPDEREVKNIIGGNINFK